MCIRDSLYLIRHGQSYVNLKEWDGGNQDTALTELGHRQAAALGAWMPTEIITVDALYASTMQRAQETAAYVSQAYGVPITNDAVSYTHLDVYKRQDQGREHQEQGESAVGG